jgi:hypothetical protein
MPRVLRRFLLWSVVCVVSAAPSFFWAHKNFHQGAMALGVAIFISLYTATTSTDAYERFHSRPFVRRTLYIGYGLRVGISIVFPVGLYADLLPGMLSMGLMEELGIAVHSFHGTLLTTCVQGTVLNILLAIFMLIVYAVQWGTIQPPSSENQARGFEVLLTHSSAASDAASIQPVILKTTPSPSTPS